MMIGMTRQRYEDFGIYMDTVSNKLKRNIAYNIRCYDYFLTYPDNAPEEELNTVKAACGVSDL